MNLVDTIPVARSKDEAAFGILRTKNTHAAVIRTGWFGQTPLDPPPANPKYCHAAEWSASE